MVISKSKFFKVQILNLLVIIICLSCSDNPDSQSDVIPNAPTSLRRDDSVSNGKNVSLYWTDNSSDETGFKIEMSINSENFQVIQSVSRNTNWVTISNLLPNTTYSYRVLANIDNNVSLFSNEVVVSTDVEGNAYTNLKIGNQIWMKENYASTKYRNGDNIPKMISGQYVQTPNGYVSWSNLTDLQYGACYDYWNGSKFPNGIVYNWYSINDPRGLAPEGWHVPTKSDWIELQNYLGGDLVAGGKLKETGTSHWRNPNVGATNQVDFTARGLGYFKFYGTVPGSSYEEEKTTCYFWSSTEYDLTRSYSYLLSDSSTRLFEIYNSQSKIQGGSVRCIKD
jgi:uncharacterized protein (TIGR02145 family)